eukprot:36235-Chlamydomonas_euryale.AAC.2
MRAYLRTHAVPASQRSDALNNASRALATAASATPDDAAALSEAAQRWAAHADAAGAAADADARRGDELRTLSERTRMRAAEVSRLAATACRALNTAIDALVSLLLAANRALTKAAPRRALPGAACLQHSPAPGRLLLPTTPSARKAFVSGASSSAIGAKGGGRLAALAGSDDTSRPVSDQGGVMWTPVTGRPSFAPPLRAETERLALRRIVGASPLRRLGHVSPRSGAVAGAGELSPPLAAPPSPLPSPRQRRRRSPSRYRPDAVARAGVRPAALAEARLLSMGSPRGGRAASGGSVAQVDARRLVLMAEAGLLESDVRLVGARPSDSDRRLALVRAALDVQRERRGHGPADGAAGGATTAPRAELIRADVEAARREPGVRGGERTDAKLSRAELARAELLHSELAQPDAPRAVASAAAGTAHAAHAMVEVTRHGLNGSSSSGQSRRRSSRAEAEPRGSDALAAALRDVVSAVAEPAGSARPALTAGRQQGWGSPAARRNISWCSSGDGVGGGR